jgi:hypothetical protein
VVAKRRRPASPDAAFSVAKGGISRIQKQPPEDGLAYRTGWPTKEKIDHETAQASLESRRVF